MSQPTSKVQSARRCEEFVSLILKQMNYGEPLEASDSLLGLLS